MMIKIYIVDRTAQGRLALSSEIEAFVRSNATETVILPPIQIIPVDVNELRHKQTAQLVILGPELAASDISYLSEIVSLSGSAAMMLVLPDKLRSLPFIERLARLGIRNFITSTTTATDFLERIICFARSEKRESAGKLVLIDSAKGGTGVTTLVASLGELLAQEGKRTAMVDLDLSSQALSRFLNVTPFLNESLGLLLTGQQSLTKESIEHALSQVWINEKNLYCVNAPPYLDDLVTRGAPAGSTFISFIEELLSTFDLVIVDLAQIRGGFRKSLYRSADIIFQLVNGEPATVYSTLLVTKSIVTHRKHSAKTFIVEIESSRPTLSRNYLRKEFESLNDCDGFQFGRTSIPFSRAASSWPASGGSAYSVGNSSFRTAVKRLAVESKLIPGSIVNPQRRRNSVRSILRKFLRLGYRNVMPVAKNSQLAPDSLYIADTPVKAYSANHRTLSLPTSTGSSLISAPALETQIENKSVEEFAA